MYYSDLMILPRFHFLEKFLDVYYIRQIIAFTEWLKRHSLEHENIFIDLPRQERSINSGFLSFIFCAPGGLAVALKKKDRQDAYAWCMIFRSAEYEIWENKEKYTDRATPLRFGLSDDEKEFALGYARCTLSEYLKTGKLSTASANNVPDIFLETANVDVALWVRGALRGSRIVESLPLIAAIHEAAIRSCRDERFKPIAAEELDTATIEIAVLSDLQLPLLDREVRANTIAPEKGYLLFAQGKRGWFLPATLNRVTFKDLNDFLRLIEKKAGVQKVLLPTLSLRIFDVDNFIESSRIPRMALALRGPIIRHDISSDDATQTLDHIATRGADFLCRMQEADGNIPPIINPLTGRKDQIDWIRLALTAWALALIGKVDKNHRYVEAARKVFTYIVSNLYGHPFITEKKRCSAFIYAYRLANELGETGEAARMHTEILDLFPKIPYGHIFYSQVALHLLESCVGDAVVLAKAEELSNAVLRKYEHRIKSGDNLELVQFPELIPLLRIIGNLHADQGMIRKSEEISQWYVSQQLYDGSFPSAIGSRFSYVRGSGKIFEVLCLEPEKNKVCIGRIVGWLSEMQYDENNTYFVEESIRKEIIGGFRHDYMNQAVWIDAVGHVLIGVARLKGVQKAV